MGDPSTHEITRLLVAWNQGDQAALDALSPHINQERRRWANRYMAGERQRHLLQPIALVVVELRFFAGLSDEESAEALKVSVSAIRRDWSLAEAWLLRELSQREPRDDA